MTDAPTLAEIVVTVKQHLAFLRACPVLLEAVDECGGVAELKAQLQGECGALEARRDGLRSECGALEDQRDLLKIDVAMLTQKRQRLAGQPGKEEISHE